MINTKEYLETLNRIPTHIMLVPKIHKYQEGDEWIGGDLNWCKIKAIRIGEIIGHLILDSIDAPIVRRPIPQHIRENAAWWALYNKLATKFITGFVFVSQPTPSYPGGRTFYAANTNVPGIKKFASIELSEKAIPILGGEETIIKLLSDGDLMSSWVAGQI